MTGYRVLAGFFVTAAVGCGAPAPVPPATRPSVLLITLDTTRADHLGCYGDTEAKTPNLDGLAARGSVFTRAIAQAAVTPVSHASILTGLDPFSHGLRVLHGNAENRLADSRVTLAEMLSEAGYQTAAFVSAFPVSERFGLNQGFETFDSEFLKEPAKQIVAPDGTVNTGRNQRHAGDTTDRALAWLAQEPDPFFLWVHYFDPHDPQVMPPKSFFARHAEAWRALPNHRELLRAVYDVEMSYMDQQLGRILDWLEARGKLEDTIIVVVADHGEGLGDHDWWTHGILYQEQIRVPLILVAPALPAGGRVEPVVRTTDIVPTVTELVGLDARHLPRMDGRSLVPLVRDGGRDPGYVAYADSLSTLTYRITPQISDQKSDILFAVIRGPWKYIHHLRRPHESELYHLGEDPRELENRFATEPDQARRMRELLRSFDFMPSERTSKERMSPQDVERLRALGYIR